MKLIFRKFLSVIVSLFYKEYACCNRCNMPWKVVEGHHVPYSKRDACFALCEHCWNELMPQERFPYYEMLINSWRSMGYKDHNGQPWDDVLANLKENILLVRIEDVDE